jgi:xylem cysteine proteinase
MMKRILERNINEPTQNIFKAYHFLFKKENDYSLHSEEGMKRLKIFEENVKFIKETNAKNLSYKVAINQFADLTNEEFKEKYLLKPTTIMEKMKVFFDDLESGQKHFKVAKNFLQEGEYEYVDIDHRGYLLGARNQGYTCGSCWAFSTMSAIEGNVNIQKRQSPDVLGYLSPQQLVDCENYRSHGCNGGWPDSAIEFLMNGRGIVSEADYPYYEKNNPCSVNLDKTVVQISDYEYCTSHAYFWRPQKPCSKELFNSILQRGPGVVLIDAYAQGFRYYHSGIWTPEQNECQEYENHAVVAVAYFRDWDYYVFRNSWGADYGDNGHVAIKYDPYSESCHTLHSLWRPIPK